VAAGMFRSLRVRNYRYYAGGQVVSLTGTWMQRVAQDWLVLELSHNSGTAIGLVLALQFGPTLVFSLWGGVLADRYDKRKILFVTQGLMILWAAVLGVLDVSGAVQLWHVYLIALILGITSSLDVPVRQSFVVEMVGPKDLQNAVSLNSVTFNLARIVGPALAGILIAAVGTGWVFLGNAVFTVAVIIGLALMRPAELFRSEPTGRTPGQLREGLRYVRGRPDLILPMVLVFMVGTFGMNWPVTMALMAKEVFGRGAAGYGLLTTAIAVGSLFGALAASRRTARPRTRVILAGAFAFGTLEAAVGLMPTYWSVVAILLPTGAAALTFTIAANSTVQLGSDPAFRGRVMALYLMCFMGGTPLGAPLVGAVADAFGPRASVVASGAVCAVAAVVATVVVARKAGVKLTDEVLHPHAAEPAPAAEPARAGVGPAAAGEAAGPAPAREAAEPAVPVELASPPEVAVDAEQVEAADTTPVRPRPYGGSTRATAHRPRRTPSGTPR
jgi:MFS family permease